MTDQHLQHSMPDLAERVPTVAQNLRCYALSQAVAWHGDVGPAGCPDILATARAFADWLDCGDDAPADGAP